MYNMSKGSAHTKVTQDTKVATILGVQCRTQERRVCGCICQESFGLLGRDGQCQQPSVVQDGPEPSIVDFFNKLKGLRAGITTFIEALLLAPRRPTASWKGRCVRDSHPQASAMRGTLAEQSYQWYHWHSVRPQGHRGPDNELTPPAQIEMKEPMHGGSRGAQVQGGSGNSEAKVHQQEGRRRASAPRRGVLGVAPLS